MGFPVLMRRHLYVEWGPRSCYTCYMKWTMWCALVPVYFAEWIFELWVLTWENGISHAVNAFFNVSELIRHYTQIYVCFLRIINLVKVMNGRVIVRKHLFHNDNWPYHRASFPREKRQLFCKQYFQIKSFICILSHFDSSFTEICSQRSD